MVQVNSSSSPGFSDGTLQGPQGLTAEAAGWVLVLWLMELAAPGRCVVRGGLGDVRETGFPPSNSQSSETKRVGRGVAQLRDRTQDPRGRTRRTGCCLLLKERETTRCFHLLQKPGTSCVQCFLQSWGGGREYVVCLWSRQLQMALFTAAPPKVSSTQLLGCAGSLLGEEGPHKK